MHDGVGGGGEQQQQLGVGGGGCDPKVLVATTLAALVVAGSAYMWKSGTLPILKNGVKSSRNLVGDDDQSNAVPVPADVGPSTPRRDAVAKGSSSALGSASDPTASGSASLLNALSRRRGSQAKSERDSTDSVDPKHDAVGGSSQRQQEAGSGATTGPLGRTSRTKERRKRGKDPTKELLKSGKLNKAVATTSKSKSDVTSASSHRQDPGSPTPSHSRLSSDSHGQSSTPRPQRRLSTSSTQITSPSSPPLSDNTTISIDRYTPTSPQRSRSQHRSHSRSRSRSRSRRSPELAGSSSRPPESSSHSPTTLSYDSLAASTISLDAGSTTSSASSSAATEGTTCSSASTAPSSLTSPTPERHLEPKRSNDSDGTPKAEDGWAKSGTSTSSSAVHSNRPSEVRKSPWDWDGAAELNSLHSNRPTPSNGSTKPPRIQPKATPGGSGSISSSEVLSGNAPPLPYASVVTSSVKSSPSTSSFSDKSDSIVETQRDRGGESNSLARQSAETGHDNRFEPGEVAFPSLNNPDSSSASPYSTSGANSASSLSRPQSRASSSSAASNSKGKTTKHARVPSGLASLPARQATNASGSTGGPRRAPTPRDGNGRPGTPNSSNSAHPPPSPSSLYHTPNFANSGNTVTVSAQTQLASLRGALEAARLREEKSKSELDKATRETESLRWENAAWRRREGELQSQIQQMAHQMQAYANYIASLNQQAHASSSHILPPNPVLPGVPPSVPAPATPSIPPPESNAQVEPTPMISADDNDTAEPPDATVAQKADPAGEGDVGTNSQIEVLTDSSTSVPGDAGSQTKPGSATDLKQTDNAVAEKEQSNVAATASTPSQPQTSLVPPAHSSPAIGTLPFGPHPVHSPLSPTFPTIPLGSFPHHHPPYFQHPSSPHPQSPGMGVIPFGFPHMPHLNHQHPPHLQQPHQHTPPYPVMTLGLNGMGPGAHVPSLQSPAPPGMMHHQHQQPPHYGSGSAPGSSTAAGFPPLTPNAHPSVGSNMGIGMMSGMNTNPSVPSPLWMSGVLPNGSAAAGNSGSVAGSSGKYATSSSPDLDLLSDPSSPSPAFFQERGRRGKNGRSGSSLSGGGSSGEKDDEGEGSKENDGDESRVGRGEDDSDDGSDFNALLADAILKRPSSIRMGSGSKTSSSNYGKDSSSSSKLGGLAGSVSLDGVWPATLSGMGQQDLGRAGREHAEEDPVAEEVESEFTFPSLSELGNVAREKRVGTPAPADAVASPKPLSTGVESLILKNEMDNPSSASIHGPGQ